MKESGGAIDIINKWGKSDSPLKAISSLCSELDGLSDEVIAQAIAYSDLDDVQKKRLVSIFDLNKAEKEAGKEASKLGLVYEGVGIKLKALGKSILSGFKWLFTNPVGQLSLLLGATVAVFAVAYKTVGRSLEKAKKKAEESANAYEESKSKLAELNSELATTKSRIEELESKDNLSFVEKGELEKLKETNRQLERQIEYQERLSKSNAIQAAVDQMGVFKESYSQNISKDAVYGYAKNNTDNLTQNRSYIGDSIDSSDELGVVLSDLVKYKAYLESAEAQQKEFLDNGDDVPTYITDNIKNYSNQIKEDEKLVEDEIAELLQLKADSQYAVELIKEKRVNGEPITQDEQELLNLYKNINNVLALVYNNIGDENALKELEFEQIFEADGVEKTVSGLVEEIQKVVDASDDYETALESFDISPILNENPKLKASYEESGLSVEEFTEQLKSMVKEAEEAANATKSADDIAEAWDKINDKIDKIQSAYSSLKTAVEEYNKYGVLSIDTLQSIISLNDKYLATLVEDGNQLKINEELYQMLATAQMNEAEALVVDQLMTELSNLTKIDQVKLTSEVIDAMGSEGETVAGLSSEYARLTNVILASGKAKEFANVLNGISSENLEAAQAYLDGAEAKLDLIAGSWDSMMNRGFGKTPTAPSDSSSGDKVEAYMAWQEARLDANQITYKKYCENVQGYLDDMYKRGKISAEDYYKYIEEKLNKQKDIYDRVLSAVSKRFDDEIEKWQDKIDALEERNDLLNDNKDQRDKALSAIDKVYQDEIDRLNEIKDNLSKENDERQRALDLEKAKYNLRRSEEQRNKKVYVEGKGYIYDVDSDAVRDAQEQLSSAELALKTAELDKQIEVLEKWKEKWGEVGSAYSQIENDIAARELFGTDYQTRILENREVDLEEFKEKYIEIETELADNEKLIESYNEKVEYYQKLKDQWSDITNVYEEQRDKLYAAQILGADWEKQILDGRREELEKFKNDYIAIQEAMTATTEKEAAARMAITDSSGSSSGSGGGSTIGTSTESPISNLANKTQSTWSKKDNSTWWNGKDSMYQVQRDGRIFKWDKKNGKWQITNYNVPFVSHNIGSGQLIKDLKIGDKNIRFSNVTGSWHTYAKGGLLPTDDSYIPIPSGEDHAGVVAWRNGERVLTKMQNENWEKWTSALPNLIKMIQPLQTLANMPDLGGVVNTNYNQPITLNIGDIHLSGVNDVDTLAQDIVRELPNKILQQINRR